jgi:hypothetical protein
VTTARKSNTHHAEPGRLHSGRKDNIMNNHTDIMTHTDNEWIFKQNLCELLKSYSEYPQDVDLYHDDRYEESATMVGLSLKDFTEAGLQEFAHVLDAEVTEVITKGLDWVSVFITGVHHREIERLSLSHAGYCSVKDYDKWFTMDKGDE